MLWQDLVLTIGSLIFAFALIPSVLSKDKPALTTSVTTGVVLFIFAFVYVTLSLWFSAVTTAFTGIVWSILAIQKIRANRVLPK
jgi:hypothetical protein